jgi:uncharacterized membrane protein YhaH (DUF805 family)
MASKSILGNFKECVTTKFATFKGRAGRGEFWKFFLIMFILNVVFGTLFRFMPQSKVALAVAVVWIVIGLFLIIPFLAVATRRMHDTGKGGGWLFINLVPLIGTVWWFILLVQDGDKKANRFDD